MTFYILSNGAMALLFIPSELNWFGWCVCGRGGGGVVVCVCVSVCLCGGRGWGWRAVIVSMDKIFHIINYYYYCNYYHYHYNDDVDDDDDRSGPDSVTAHLRRVEGGTAEVSVQVLILAQTSADLDRVEVSLSVCLSVCLSACMSARLSVLLIVCLSD